jgi:hypothetical protein
VGGRTKDEVPTPVFLRSGDVVLMSGESRRLAWVGGVGGVSGVGGMSGWVGQVG